MGGRDGAMDGWRGFADKKACRGQSTSKVSRRSGRSGSRLWKWTERVRNSINAPVSPPKFHTEVAFVRPGKKACDGQSASKVSRRSERSLNGPWKWMQRVRNSVRTPVSPRRSTRRSTPRQLLACIAEGASEGTLEKHSESHFCSLFGSSLRRKDACRRVVR